MDRSRFKGGSVKSIKESRQEAEEKSGSGNRTLFHNVEEGTNVFRIGPPHPENTRPYVPIRRTLLECNAEIWEDGQPTDRKELRNKSIFISTIHGSTEKDIVEIYCKYVYRSTKEKCAELTGKEKDKKEAELLFPIRGGRVSGKYRGGLQPSTNYMCYALKDGRWGRLELYAGWMKRVEELNIDEDGDEEAAIDRFSDPSNGVHLIITKKKREKKDGFDYILSKREFKPEKHKSWEEFIKGEQITDDQLKEFEEFETLEVLYGADVYRRKDFELAVDGLQRFDEKHKYNIFQNEDFLAEFKEIEAYYPEEEDEQPPEDKVLPFSGDKDSETLTPNGIDFTTYSLPGLRKYINAYIDENYPGKKLPALTKPELLKWAILVEKEEELPFTIDGSSPEVEEKAEPKAEEKTEVKKVESTISKEAQDRINKLKDLAKGDK